MRLSLACLFLLSGAALSLLAAIGVLRLPDFFMRMHAATKAGVAGCGLMLIGVGLVDGTPATWTKVFVAILFLALTTPVAGHLLGRAAYLGGAPFWSGTRADALHGVLPRGRFEESREPPPGALPARIGTVVLALAKGPHMESAMLQALAIARRHRAEVIAVAIVDVPRLSNVGPVPIGAGWHAQQMRERRIRLARLAAAEVIQRFEELACGSDLHWTVRLEEGRPGKVLNALTDGQCLLAVAPGGWFDQGVLELKVDVSRRLRWSGLRREALVLGPQAGVSAGTLSG